jgi:hypothetical protein
VKDGGDDVQSENVSVDDECHVHNHHQTDDEDEQVVVAVEHDC